MNDDEDKQKKEISTENRDKDYAVALSYDQSSSTAPKVVAKGEGHIAQKIIELAIDNNIEIKQDKDLVQILKAVDIDETIPIEAFSAVAEILSYIYQKNSNS